MRREKQMFKGKRTYFAIASLAGQKAYTSAKASEYKKVKGGKVLTWQHRLDLPASGMEKSTNRKKL
jgi:hypothetical protein